MWGFVFLSQYFNTQRLHLVFLCAFNKRTPPSHGVLLASWTIFLDLFLDHLGPHKSLGEFVWEISWDLAWSKNDGTRENKKRLPKRTSPSTPVSFPQCPPWHTARSLGPNAWAGVVIHVVHTWLRFPAFVLGLHEWIRSPETHWAKDPKRQNTFRQGVKLLLKITQRRLLKGAWKVFSPFNTSPFLLATSSIFSFLTRLYVTPKGRGRRKWGGGEVKGDSERQKRNTVDKAWNYL